jgi:hypothetical protein
MNDFKLKLILAVLGSVVFSFVFILLAFIMPTKNEDTIVIKKHNNILEEVSSKLRE